MKPVFFINSLLLLSTLILYGCQPTSDEKPVDDKVKSMTLSIEYITEILKPPKKKDASIWIPIPKNDTDQEISDFKVDSRFPYTIDEDSRKNRMLFIKSSDLKSGDKVVLTYSVKRKVAGINKDKSARPEDYLKPTEWEEWDEEIEAHLNKLIGNEKDPVEIGRKVYNSIIDMFEYIHEICGRGVSAIAFEEKTGRCDEYSALFRTMMMYKGIPVRWEQGMMLPYPSEINEAGELEADCFNARSWVSFYIGDGRWMPVDLAEGKRRPELREYYFGNLVPNVIKYSTGRGLTLNPPQEMIINTFPYSYVEAGGFPAIYGHNYKNTLRYRLIEIK